MMIDFDYLFQAHNVKATGVLHLGASEGQEMSTYRRLGMKPVVFVEAIQSVYVKLLQHLLTYPEATAINECVSDVDGQEVIFNVSNNDAQSSSFLELGHHKVIHPSVHYIEQIKMTTKTVVTIVREYGIDLSEINFLNADLQGVELLALKGMGALILNFKYLYLEVNKKPTYIGCAHVDEIDLYVADYGFRRVETGTWVADTWTDALYERL
jgi:FkbM family methyltransferase